MKKLILVLALGLSSTISNAQSGLYLRLQYFGQNLDIQWLYVQDSFIVRNPQHGITPIQIEKEISAQNENVAQIFQEADNKISLRWSNGVYEAFNITYKNKDYASFKGVPCAKAIPYQVNTFNNKRYSGLVNFYNQSKNIELFLGSDGHFTYENKDTNLKEEGSYAINGNTIVFKYSSGKEWKAFIHAFDNGKDDIIINQQLFKRIN